MSKRDRIPGKRYTMVKAIDGDQITAEANRLLEIPGIGNAGLVKSKGHFYLAIDSTWMSKHKEEY